MQTKSSHAAAQQNTVVTVARWIAFVPAALIAYVVATEAVFFGISYGIPEVASAVRYAPDFAGHIIFGPLTVFTWFSVATALAVYAGISVAPSHRKIAVILLGMIIAIFIGVGIFGMSVSLDRHLITGQMLFRTFTEVIGMIAGFAGGIALAFESSSFKPAN